MKRCALILDSSLRAGLVLGLLECALLVFGIQLPPSDGTAASSLILSLPRSALAFGLAGLIATPLILLLASLLARSRALGTLTLLAIPLVAAVTAWSVARPAPLTRFSSASLWLLVGALGSAGAGAALLAWLPRRFTRMTAYLFFPAVAGLMILDPAHLRGTYLSLATLLMGMAFGLCGIAWAAVASSVSLRVLLIRSLAALVILLTLARTGVLTHGQALILANSDRTATLHWLLATARVLPQAQSPGRGTSASDRDVILSNEVLEEARAERDRRSPVTSAVIVIIDALHEPASRIKGVAPHLKELRGRGVSFVNAFTQTPATSVAMESLFGGRYPTSSGIGQDRPVHREGLVPALLTDAGLATIFVTGLEASKLKNPFFARIAEGFATVSPQAGATDAFTTVERALTLVPAEKPYVLVVHLFDPHAPYEARNVPKSAPRRERWLSEIRHADAALGHLLETLEERGRLKETLVIATADHGEAFGEHGRNFHASSFFDVQVHVPLVIALPTDVRMRNVEAPVGLLDLAPTLLDVLHLPPSPHHEGQSLLPYLFENIPSPRAAFAETVRNWPFPKQRMVTDGRYKLLHDLDTEMLLLFDRQTDPEEHHDLASKEPQVRERLLGLLEWFERRKR